SFVPRALPDGTTDWADGTAASVAEKVAWVREAAGDRLGTLELNVYVRGVAITADRQGAAGRLARQVGVGAADVLDSPFALAGTVEQIAEELRARRERYGISYVVVRDQVMEEFAPVVAHLAGT